MGGGGVRLWQGGHSTVHTFYFSPLIPPFFMTISTSTPAPAPTRIPQLTNADATALIFLFPSFPRRTAAGRGSNKEIWCLGPKTINRGAAARTRGCSSVAGMTGNCGSSRLHSRDGTGGPGVSVEGAGSTTFFGGVGKKEEVGSENGERHAITEAR